MWCWWRLLLPATLSVAPREWRAVKLSDCIVINGSAYSPTEKWALINYLDTGNITQNRVLKIQNLWAAEDKVPNRARRKVREGYIVYFTVRSNQPTLDESKGSRGTF